MHSLFAHMEVRATHSALASARDNKRPFILTRSSFAGTGRYAAKWLGDNNAEFDDMKMSIPGLLTSSIFGFSMIGADICGFGAPSDASIMEELCARWMQLGAWYPFSRNHNAQNNPGHEPFRMGNVVLEASRQALTARMALTLYFYTLFHAAATDGGTVARPLSFEFPDDTSTWDIDTQFMVGPAIMVSPALERGVERVEVYFPGGADGDSVLVSTVWYDYWTGKRVVVSPSRRLSVPAPLGLPMPVHIRGGQIVPRQVAGLTTATTVSGAINLLVALPTNDCGGTHGVAAAGSMYFDDGETELSSALRSKVALTTVWMLQEPCYHSKPRGFAITGAPTETAYADVPAISNITVFGAECPPGTVTLSVDGAGGQLVNDVRWDAVLKIATIQVSVNALTRFQVDYTCGTWGHYTLQPTGLQPNTDTGLQADLKEHKQSHRNLMYTIVSDRLLVITGRLWRTCALTTAHLLPSLRCRWQ